MDPMAIATEVADDLQLADAVDVDLHVTRVNGHLARLKDGGVAPMRCVGARTRARVALTNSPHAKIMCTKHP